MRLWWNTVVFRSKKVFVSGCYDMLHSGHVAFFKEASALGDLYVKYTRSDEKFERMDIGSSLVWGYFFCISD